jgi:hypothetical protein
MDEKGAQFSGDKNESAPPRQITFAFKAVRE